VLDLLHYLKGAAAMTDPKDIETSQTQVDGELPEAALDDVTGGVSFAELAEEQRITGFLGN
jgi:hypothetical protein